MEIYTSGKIGQNQMKIIEIIIYNIIEKNIFSEHSWTVTTNEKKPRL